MKLSPLQWRSIRLTLLAWLVLSALLVCSYIALHRKYFGVVSDALLLTRNDSSFSVFSKGTCVGVFDTEFEEGDTITVSGNGYLAIRSGEIDEQVDFSVEFNFNLLRQLVGSVVDLKSRAGSVRIGALQVNPILLTVLLVRGQESFRVNQEIPGPVLLVDAPGGFTLRYDGAWRFSEFNLADQPLFRSLSLEIKEGEESRLQCEEAPGALDITEIISLFSILSQSVNSYLHL